MNVIVLGQLSALILGFLVGAKLPDVDLAPVGLWRHRSAWTHGPLLPLLAWRMSDAHPLVWWALVGALPAYAIHLLSDAFPKAWNGGALIKLYPLPGALGAVLSFVYILGGVAACGWVFWKLIEPVAAQWIGGLGG